MHRTRRERFANEHPSFSLRIDWRIQDPFTKRHLRVVHIHIQSGFQSSIGCSPFYKSFIFCWDWSRWFDNGCEEARIWTVYAAIHTLWPTSFCHIAGCPRGAPVCRSLCTLRTPVLLVCECHIQCPLSGLSFSHLSDTLTRILDSSTGQLFAPGGWPVEGDSNKWSLCSSSGRIYCEVWIWEKIWQVHEEGEEGEFFKINSGYWLLNTQKSKCCL